MENCHPANAHTEIAGGLSATGWEWSENEWMGVRTVAPSGAAPGHLYAYVLASNFLVQCKFPRHCEPPAIEEALPELKTWVSQSAATKKSGPRYGGKETPQLAGVQIKIIPDSAASL